MDFKVSCSIQPESYRNWFRTDQSNHQVAQWKGLFEGLPKVVVEEAPDPTAKPESLRWLLRFPHSGQSMGASISENRRNSVNSV